VKRAAPLILLALLGLQPPAGTAGLVRPALDALSRKTYEKVELVYRNTCTVRFSTLREQLPCMETEFKFRAPNEFKFQEPTDFKSWAPTADSYQEALVQVAALATFREIAEDLQKQVDAGSLSDRVAMNRLEGDLLDILYDQPDGPSLRR
jgi:hypothetical protein